MAIPQNRYVEALRLFLEGAAADWFVISTKLIGVDEEWSAWNKSFVQNFGSKGWQEVRTAYNFKFLHGLCLCLKKNVRQFLGKVNFYLKFIENSSSLLQPLHYLLRKNVPFIWSNKCQESFEKVKSILSSFPVLAVFDRTRPIHIYTDASLEGIGAVLKQPQEDGFEKTNCVFF